MASAAIAIALVFVAVLSVPVPLWAARVLASFRRRPRPGADPSTADLAELAPGLRQLVVLGRRTCRLIDALGPVAADYRRTLPYLNLFFADVRTCLDARSARWVVTARQDYELAVSDLSRLLVSWRAALAGLAETEQVIVDDANGTPGSVVALLEDGSRLPRSPIEAQRLRFCESWEVEQLEESLERIAEDLTRFEAALLDVRVGPYR